MQKHFINYKSNDLNLIVDNYINNKTLYLGLVGKDEEYFADITHNLLSVSHNDKNIVYLDSSLSKDLINKLKRKGLIKNILGEMPCNYGVYKVALIDLDIVKKYDKNGYQRFENEYNSFYNKESKIKNNLKHKSNEIEL